MPCGNNSRRFAQSVWTDGSATATFIAFTRVKVEKWRSIRVSVLLEGSSGNLTVDAALLYADIESELVTNTPVAIPVGSPTSRDSDGQDFGADYTDLDVSQQMVEVGVNAYNGAGSKREAGRVTLIIDLLD